VAVHNVVAPAPRQSEQAASRVQCVMSTFCKVTRGVGGSLSEYPVQRYSEVFGLRATGQGFVVVVDFPLTFSFLVVEVEDCPHCFFSPEL